MEGISFAFIIFFIACVAILFLGLLLATLLFSLLVLIGGVIATALSLKLFKPRERRLAWIPAILTIVAGLIFLLVASFLYGRIQQSLAPTRSVGAEYVSIDDVIMKPYIAAMSGVDRASLGFTPIPADARIRIDRLDSSGTKCDAMLHVYTDTSRTITFKQYGNSCKWIHEQEIHIGPHKYPRSDTIYEEEIVIEYQTEEVNGIPLNKIFIYYYGDDPRLGRKLPFTLTLQDVQPILEEWKEWRARQTPVPSR